MRHLEFRLTMLICKQPRALAFLPQYDKATPCHSVIVSVKTCDFGHLSFMASPLPQNSPPTTTRRILRFWGSFPRSSNLCAFHADSSSNWNYFFVLCGDLVKRGIIKLGPDRKPRRSLVSDSKSLARPPSKFYFKNRLLRGCSDLRSMH